MESNKLLVFIRYMSMLFLVVGIVVFKRNNIDIIAVILVLLFIVNNQLRFFMLKERKIIVFLSLMVECVLAYFCYKNYGGIEFFYFLTAALDSAFLLKGKYAYLASAIAVLTLILINKKLSINYITSSAAALITVSILASYIREEYASKIQAQTLYDKLRISEDRLKKANVDLEAYASSIEELTLLRERNRISREIHDSVGHSLSTIIIQLRALEKVSKQKGQDVSELAANLREFANGSLQEVRSAVRELKPREFEQYEGILAVEELIKSFMKLTGIDVKLSFTKEKWTLNSDQSFVIYRVVQEFLSNSLRHGKATKINVFMSFSKENLILTMQDNGMGTDKVERGIGLTSIYERVKELGGTVEYSSKKGEGFLLKVVLRPMESLVF